jgi:hypothetical protein
MLENVRSERNSVPSRSMMNNPRGGLPAGAVES